MGDGEWGIPGEGKREEISVRIIVAWVEIMTSPPFYIDASHIKICWHPLQGLHSLLCCLLCRVSGGWRRDSFLRS
jgi:hypothetical protein